MHRLLMPLFILTIALSSAAGQTEDKTKKPLPPEIREILKLSPEEFIKRFDKNNDGFLTQDELPGVLAKGFAKADANGDGKLDRGEVEQLLRIVRQFAARQNPFAKGDADSIVAALLKQFDTDMDGKISKEEARGRLAENFAFLDKNKDGFLDRTELRAMAERILAQRKGPGPEENRFDFDALDKNADGRLSRAELKGTVWESRFAEIDANGDGQIDRQEFERFLRKEAEKKPMEK